MMLILNNDIINLIDFYSRDNYVLNTGDKLTTNELCEKNFYEFYYDELLFLHRFCPCIQNYDNYNKFIYKIYPRYYTFNTYNISLPKSYYYTSGLNCKSGYKNE